MTPSATGFQFGDNLSAIDMGGGVVRVDATPALPPGTAVGQVLTWNGSAWTPTTPDLVKIAEVVLASSQAAITFSSIPQTYRNLKGIAFLRADHAVTVDIVKVRSNGITSGNYLYHNWWAAGATATTAAGTLGATFGFAGLCTGANASLGTWGASEWIIPNYTSAQPKSMLAYAGAWGVNTSGDPQSWHNQTVFNFSGATSELTFFTNGNFIAGSMMQLYGLK